MGCVGLIETTSGPSFRPVSYTHVIGEALRPRPFVAFLSEKLLRRWFHQTTTCVDSRVAWSTGLPKANSCFQVAPDASTVELLGAKLLNIGGSVSDAAPTMGDQNQSTELTDWAHPSRFS